MLDSKTVTPDGFCFVARRNCSMGPWQACACLGVAAGMSLTIAAGWALAGAWLVLPFAGLELAALILAVTAFGRHVGDRESVAGSRGRVVVEIREAGRTARHVFVPQCSRLIVDGDGAAARLALCAAGQEVEIGRFLGEEERVELVRELRRWIPLR
jgi:uncharacterized membrane protein